MIIAAVGKNASGKDYFLEYISKEYGIPIGTLHHWEAGDRKPPEYVLQLLWRVVQADIKKAKK